MNTSTLSTETGQQSHPPHPTERTSELQLERQPERQLGTARTIGPLDRIALHIGLALITWGRRSINAESRERRANRIEQQLAQLQREQAAERQLRLLLPRL